MVLILNLLIGRDTNANNYQNPNVILGVEILESIP